VTTAAADCGQCMILDSGKRADIAEATEQVEMCCAGEG